MQPGKIAKVRRFRGVGLGIKAGWKNFDKVQVTATEVQKEMARNVWLWVGIGCLIFFFACCCLATTAIITYGIWG
jgi:hypothetical protein